MAGDKMWLEVANLVGKQNKIDSIFSLKTNLKELTLNKGLLA